MEKKPSAEVPATKEKEQQKFPNSTVRKSTLHKHARSGDAQTPHPQFTAARRDLVSQIGRTASSLSILSSKVTKRAGFTLQMAHDQSLLVRLGLSFMPKYEKSFQSLRREFCPSRSASGVFILVWVVTYVVFFSFPLQDSFSASVAVAGICFSATMLFMQTSAEDAARRRHEGHYFEEIVVLLVLSFAVLFCASDSSMPKIPISCQELATNDFSSAHFVVLVIFQAHVHCWRLNPLYTFLATHACVATFAYFHFTKNEDWIIFWSLEIVASCVSIDAALWEKQLRQLFRLVDELSDERVRELPRDSPAIAKSMRSTSNVIVSESPDLASIPGLRNRESPGSHSTAMVSRKSSSLTRSKKNEFYDTLQGIHACLNSMADVMHEPKTASSPSPPSSPTAQSQCRQMADQVEGLITSMAYWGSRVTDYWRTIIQPEPKSAGKLTVITHPSPEYLRMRRRKLTPKRITQEADNMNGQLHLIGEWNLNALLLEQETHGALRLVCEFFMDAHWFPFVNVAEMQDLCIDIESHYLPERQFHNSVHAADVTNSFYCLGVSVTGVWGQLSKERICACILAAAAHDVGHPGRTNRVLVNSMSDLALRYNDRSVLENMHASTLFRLMRSHEKALDLDLEAYKRFKWFCVTLILATDTEVHFEEVHQMKAIIENTNGKHWDFESMTEKELLVVIKHCIRTSDIGHCARDFSEHLLWSHAIQKEFDEQAAEERRLGLPISPTSQSSLIPGQISFFQYIVLPSWELLAELSKPVYSFVPYTVIKTANRQRGLLHREDSELPVGASSETSVLDTSIDEKVLFKRAMLNGFIWKQIHAGVISENGPYPTEIKEDPVPLEQTSQTS